MAHPRVVDFRWTALLNEFRRSGLTQAEFCERRGLSIHTFRKHLYAPRPAHAAPRDEPPPPANTAPFLPVTVLPDPVSLGGRDQPALELVLRNGRRIAVAPGFDPETLRQLLHVAEAAPCSD